ncbi:MAG: nicotinate-nucleotide adenylyltransferase [Chloroflexota bacterium]
MRLGVLGGTFDPIHIGHLLMAESCWQSLQLERVLFLPAGDPPHKRDRLKTPAHHRAAMVSQAIAPNSNFELCTIDLDRPGPHYTSDTLTLIQTHYQVATDDCFFIIGGDSLQDLPLWHEPQTVIQWCRLAVVHRPDYEIDLTHLEARIPGLAERLDWVEMPLISSSSSELRQRVAEGLTIRYQVVEAVRTYIERHNLYNL